MITYMCCLQLPFATPYSCTVSIEILIVCELWWLSKVVSVVAVAWLAHMFLWLRLEQASVINALQIESVKGCVLSCKILRLISLCCDLMNHCMEKLHAMRWRLVLLLLNNFMWFSIVFPFNDFSFMPESNQLSVKTAEIDLSFYVLDSFYEVLICAL